MFLNTYLIFYSELACAHSVKGINLNVKIMDSIASDIINIYSSYIDPYLVAEFIQFD